MFAMYLQIITASTVIITIMCYAFVKRRFNYWRDRNVSFTEPSFPLGNCQGLNRTVNFGDILKEKYFEGQGLPYYGFFLTLSPVLIIRDPELIKQILIKDANIFFSRGFRINPLKDPISAHLFFLDGQDWRNTRVKLTPAFTSGKLKQMFPIFEQSCREMHDYLLERTNQNIEAGLLFTKLTTNIITRTAFGIDVDFFKNPNVQFENMIEELRKPSKVDAIKRALAFTLGLFLGELPIPLVPKRLADYFIGIINDAVQYRKENNVQRKDFLQLLMELISKGYIDDADAKKDYSHDQQTTKFTISNAAASSFGFLLGGFDTSATILECCTFNLAIYPDIQKRARKEIHAVISKHNGQLDYDAMGDLVYLEQVINETIRMYPVTPNFARLCNEDYQIPNSNLVIKKGTTVWISLKGLQSDPEHFPNPDHFDPERFSIERKHEIKQCTFMPFGDGPRNCIGSRFAMMQMKAGLAYFLHNFEVHKCNETPQPPLKFDPKKTIALVLGGVTVKVTPIKS